MSDIKWTSLDGEKTILVPYEEHGIMVRQASINKRREKWVTWDEFFNQCDQIEKLQKTVDQQERVINSMVAYIRDCGQYEGANLFEDTVERIKGEE